MYLGLNVIVNEEYVHGKSKGSGLIDLPREHDGLEALSTFVVGYQPAVSVFS